MNPENDEPLPPEFNAEFFKEGWKIPPVEPCALCGAVPTSVLYHCEPTCECHHGSEDPKKISIVRWNAIQQLVKNL